MPGLAYSGFLMTEVLFYPVMALAAWATARALERPTFGRQALAVAAAGAAVLTRLQALALFPVLLVAVALKLLFDRAGWRSARRFLPLLAVGAAGTAYSLISATRGRQVLGAYEPTGRVHYTLGDSLRFVEYHFGDLALMMGVIPVVALAVVAVRALAGREESNAVRAYLAVTLPLTGAYVVEVALFATRFVGRLAERDLLSLAPLLALAFALWLDRGAPRPWLVTAGACAAAFGLVAALPATLFSEAAVPDALTVTPFYRLHANAPSIPIRPVVVAGAAAAVVLVAFVPRRWIFVLPLTVVLFLCGTSYNASRFVAHQAIGLRPLMVGTNLRWIDRAAYAPAAHLYTGEYLWNAVWYNAFWNRSVDRVYFLGTQNVLGPIPQTRVFFGPEGKLVDARGQPVSPIFVVASSSVEVDGQRVASAQAAGLTLWHVNPPLRLKWAATGFSPYADVLGAATIHPFECGNKVLRLNLVAPGPRTLLLQLNGRTLRTVHLRAGEIWAGEIPGPARAGACTFRFAALGGFHVNSLNVVPRRAGAAGTAAQPRSLRHP